MHVTIKPLWIRSFDSQAFQRKALPYISWMPSGQGGHVSSWTWWSPCVGQWKKEEEELSVMCKQHASSELPLQLHFSKVEKNRRKQSGWFWNEPFFLSQIQTTLQMGFENNCFISNHKPKHSLSPIAHSKPCDVSSLKCWLTKVVTPTLPTNKTVKWCLCT